MRTDKDEIRATDFVARYAGSLILNLIILRLSFILYVRTIGFSFQTGIFCATRPFFLGS